MKTKPIVGILGAGKLGTVLGRLAVNAGYTVLIAGSKTVDRIALTVDVLVPGAIPKTKTEVVLEAEIIFLCLPLSKMRSIPLIVDDNKVVIDAMNYWMEVDGLAKIPSDPNLTSSELVASVIQSSKIVKAFNHMGYHDIEFESHAPIRKVIAVASDDQEAKETVMTLVHDFGFDSLDLGDLKAGKILEPGSELFGANLTKEEFQNVITKLSA